MTTSAARLSAILEQLDTSCTDAQERLLIACRYTSDDPDLERELEDMAATRRQLQRQLRTEMRAQGEASPKRVSFGRGVRRVLAAAKTALQEDPVQAQIEECHVGAVFLVRDFESALEQALPARVRGMLESHLRVLRGDLAKLRGFLRRRPGHSQEGEQQPAGEPSEGRFDCFGLTHVGKKRQVNQDQFLIAELRKSMFIHQSSLDFAEHTSSRAGSHGQLLAVADGMGGHAAGDEASSVAMEGLRRYVLDTMPWLYHVDNTTDEKRLRAALGEVLNTCQEFIRDAQEAHPEHAGMGTTLTLAYILWPQVYVVHAGDSRCYLQRSGRLERMTTDHTLAQQLVDMGKLKENEAQASRQSHVLWNVLGGADDALEADVHCAELRFGDTIVLCSDGLTKHVADEALHDILKDASDAEEVAERLLAGALDGGGTDNVTVIVGRFETAPTTSV